MSCTCGEKGAETFVCGEPLGHDYKEVEGTYKAPTCAEPGKEADLECTRCHDVIIGKEKPKTNDHRWKEATGYAPKTCEICGLTEGDAIRYTTDTIETPKHKRGKKDSLTITYHRSENDASVIDHLENVRIDGNEIAVTTDRSANSITIASEILNDLASGDHKLKVVFDDWEEELDLTIEPAVTPQDLVIPIAVVAVLGLSGGCAAIIIKKCKAV
jgi:hypothetical protein